MQFDKQEHQELALQMIDSVNVPGKLIDLVHEYRQAVLNADIRNTKEAAAEQAPRPVGRPRKQTLRDVTGAPKYPTPDTADTAQVEEAAAPATETAGPAEAPKRSWPARKPRGTA